MKRIAAAEVKRAFTLAEVMIVLTVIGIISAIIMPIAFQTVPDENVLKFKKANSVLYQVINELVNSDKYYKDGDLAIRADGVQIYNDASNYKTNYKYFCKTFADVVSAKNTNCEVVSSNVAYYVTLNGKTLGSAYTVSDATDETIKEAKEKLDSYCKTAAKLRGKEIELVDGTVFYKIANTAFGSSEFGNDDGTKTILRFFSPPNQFPANYADTNGFDMVYLPFCLDVDGFDESVGSANCDDIKDICPFGYGIRADGKILPGQRADEWLKKDIQEG